MSSSRPPPPPITRDLSRRPDEGTIDHLTRIGDECRVPRRYDLPTPKASHGNEKEITDDEVAKMSAEALAKLRPPKRNKRGK